MIPANKIETAVKDFCKKERYDFQGHAGSGSFKIVYKIGDSTGQTYALKIIFDTGISKRSKREIESLIRCNHKNICKIHKTGTILIDDNDYQIIIEDYLPGGTLSTFCQKNGLLSLEQASVLGMQLVDVLAYLKELDLVHRDIKPDNILLRNSICDPVLIDFGLVRDIKASSLTETWVLAGPGTPYFASPEQLNNDKHLIDWRSDQFSLGVLISLCYLGTHPYQLDSEPLFSSSTVERVAERKKHGENFITKASQGNLPFLIRMTEPWPVERYRDPHELKKLFSEVYNVCLSSNGSSFE